MGSFRKVAERLNTTQPAISSRIAALEDTLGGKLFERGPRVVTLTALGQSMVPCAEKIIYMTDRMRAQAGSARETDGVLRLGVSETIVHTRLPAFLRPVHNRYPGLDVDLTVEFSPQLPTDILAQRLDLALLLGPVPAPEAASFAAGASWPLGQQVLVARGRGHRPLRRRLQATEDVRAFGVVMSEQGADQIERTHDAISRLGLIWRGLSNQLAVAAAPALEAVADAMAAIANRTGPLGQTIAGLFDNIGRLTPYAATFAAFLASRWVPGWLRRPSRCAASPRRSWSCARRSSAPASARL